AALLYGSGYAANLGIISSLMRPGDYIFSDRLNHASIIDGCRLSKAKIVVFDHNDMDTLEAKLRLTATSLNGRSDIRKLIVVDSIFSMDGDLAPLPQLVTLAEKYQAILMVDEAHATGTIGPVGRGAVAHFGLEKHVPLVMGTLSKSLGGYGAFVAGSRKLIEYLTNTSRSFIFSTALPPTVIASALAALETLEANPSLVTRLQNNAEYLRKQLTLLGYDTLNSQTHIIPVLVGEATVALEMSRRLLAEGVLAVAIRPPTVPAGKSRIRVTVMANHSRDDLDFALEAFHKVHIVLDGKVTGSGTSSRTRG
ncbi:MAG: aminotransferase class I/II-fold pyridoxal phosphate-dependent enzyme, partial [Dehalococcoidia bacterium]|nr:aminotransferase class I/II-fold pyridoxal phosphate-dependent enzyme [Dehalococcoidia bacterium]